MQNHDNRRKNNSIFFFILHKNAIAVRFNYTPNWKTFYYKHYLRTNVKSSRFSYLFEHCRLYKAEH